MKFRTTYTSKKENKEKYIIPIEDIKYIKELDPEDDRILLIKDTIKMSDFINESRELTNFKKYIAIDKNNNLIYNKEARPAVYADISFLKKSGAENIETLRKAKETIEKLNKETRKRRKTKKTAETKKTEPVTNKEVTHEK